MSDDLTDETPDSTLLDRYFTGECTTPEVQRVSDWLARHPARAREASGLRRALDLVREARPAAVTTDRDVARVRERVSEGAATSAHLRVRLARDASRFSRLGGIGAGTAAIVILASYAGWGVLRHTAAQPVREFSTKVGSQAMVTLRDGTRLVLGPATHLRVPDDFGRIDRSVILDGEAQFTVTHDARHPFAVRTAHAVVRDVGTTFVVHAYADEPAARVAVEEGRVSLRVDSGVPVSLAASDLALLTGRGLTIYRQADLSSDIAWLQGRLAFRDTPLMDAIRTLQHTYNIEIVLADSTLATDRVTASFGEEPEPVVLDAIAQIVGAHIQRDGRRVTIIPGLAPRRVAPASHPIPVIQTATAATTHESS